MTPPCTGKTELFYPEDHIAQAGTPEWHEEVAAVVARYCLRCPMRLECFAAGVEDPWSRGIWGGVDFLARRPWTEREVPLRCECGEIIDPLPRLRTGEDTTQCWRCNAT